MPKVTYTKKYEGKHERDVCVLNGQINYKNKSTNEEIYHTRNKGKPSRGRRESGIRIRIRIRTSEMNYGDNTYPLYAGLRTKA